MCKTNDDTIMELKAKIAQKREKLATLKSKFVPETTCSIALDGVIYNLHVMDKPSLVLLICKLNALYESAKSLECVHELVISGYNIETWMEDVRSRLSSMDYASEMKKLAGLESRLDSMLSDNKKTEIELESIADEIGF